MLRRGPDPSPGFWRDDIFAGVGFAGFGGFDLVVGGAFAQHRKLLPEADFHKLGIRDAKRVLGRQAMMRPAGHGVGARNLGQFRQQPIPQFR